MSTRRAAIVGALALLVAMRPAWAEAACLSSTTHCMGNVQTTAAPTAHVECDNAVFGVSAMDFDVPAHTADILESESGTANLAELFLDDQFTVSGPPAGSPIHLHLRIRYHGHASSYGPVVGGSLCTVSAAALEPVAGDSAPSQTFQAPGSTQVPVSFADSLDFTLARTAGNPIGIQMYFSVAHGYDERIDADFVFVDLPPGANVTSCKGYSQDQPVPAFTKSWGSLKAAYR